MKLINTLILLMLCTCGWAQVAQDTVTYGRLTLFPVATVEYTYMGQSDYKERDFGDGEIGFNEVTVEFQYVHELKNKKTLLYGQLNYNQVNAISLHDNKLHAATLGLGVIQKLKNRWKIIGILSPTYASDGQHELDKNDIMLQGTFLINKRINPYFECGIGLSRSARGGRKTWFPIAMIAFKKNQWSINGILPSRLNAYYHIKKSKIGLSLNLSGNVYNEIPFGGYQPIEAQFGYSRVNFGPHYQAHLYKSFYLNLKGGLSVFNQLGNPKDETSVYYDLSSKQRYFVSVGVNMLM